MSGITIEQEINGGVQPDAQGIDAAENNFANMPDGGGGFSFSEFLKAKTGDGHIEAYMSHPLNFNGSRTLARIIRGATGLLGELDYAIVDIGLGLLEYMKGRAASGTQN